MTLLYLDIETLPASDSSLVEVFPPKTMMRPETIEKWWKEESPQAIKEALAKTSFDGLYGSICVICWAFDDGEIQEAHTNEKEALMAFYSSVAEKAKIKTYDRDLDGGLTVIGHNVAGFDLPFIKHRSIIHNIKPVAQILKAMSAKPWGNEIGDTMLMWSDNRDKRVSLDKLCKALGIPGQGDFDGSMVAETWPIDPQKVIDYCKDDVERVRQIYKRLTFA